MSRVSLATRNVWHELPGFGILEGMTRERHPPELKEEILERVELLRRAKGYETNSYWAALLEISPSAWNEIKQGRNAILPDLARRICLLTGADWNYIYGGEMAGLTDELRQGIARIQKEDRRKRR